MTVTRFTDFVRTPCTIQLSPLGVGRQSLLPDKITGERFQRQLHNLGEHPECSCQHIHAISTIVCTALKLQNSFDDSVIFCGSCSLELVVFVRIKAEKHNNDFPLFCCQVQITHMSKAQRSATLATSGHSEAASAMMGLTKCTAHPAFRSKHLSCSLSLMYGLSHHVRKKKYNE